MERPIMKPLGAPMEELDTPALVVDLDALEHNLDLVHSLVAASGVNIRPRLDAHLCPAIGHMQMAAGAVSGSAVSTLGQAEVFAQYGFRDLLVTNIVATASKAARAASLSARTDLTIGADSLAGIAALNRAALGSRSNIGVALPIRAGDSAIGVLPASAVELAKAIAASPDLRFAGIFSADEQNPPTESKTRLSALLDAASACADRGLPPDMVACGGSKDYDDVASTDGVTDVLAGAYALGEARLVGIRQDIRAAAMILAAVMSQQDDGGAWLDAGQKATSIDTGLPLVADAASATVTRMSAEHGGLEFTGSSIELGERLQLIPHDIANTVNVYDYIHAVRNGKLEAVWEVSARGRYD